MLRCINLALVFQGPRMTGLRSGPRVGSALRALDSPHAKKQQLREKFQRDLDGIVGAAAKAAPRRARFSPALARRPGGVFGALARNARGSGICLSAHRLPFHRRAADDAADAADDL